MLHPRRGSSIMLCARAVIIIGVLKTATLGASFFVGLCFNSVCATEENRIIIAVTGQSNRRYRDQLRPPPTLSRGALSFFPFIFALMNVCCGCVIVLDCKCAYCAKGLVYVPGKFYVQRKTCFLQLPKKKRGSDFFDRWPKEVVLNAPSTLNGLRVPNICLEQSHTNTPTAHHTSQPSHPTGRQLHPLKHVFGARQGLQKSWMCVCVCQCALYMCRQFDLNVSQWKPS